jgi:esterase/lipase superfamily enzyme
LQDIISATYIDSSFLLSGIPKLFFIWRTAVLTLACWLLLAISSRAQEAPANNGLRGGFAVGELHSSPSQPVKHKRVFFVTNRNIDFDKVNIARTRDSKTWLRYEELFSSSMSLTLSYGWFVVSYPSDHKPGQQRFAIHISTANSWRHIGIQYHQIANSLEEFKSMIDGLSDKNGRSLVYIHGMNNTVKTAAEQTTLLAVDLNVKGAPILFSWPSDGAPIPLNVELVHSVLDRYKENAQVAKDSRPYLHYALADISVTPAGQFDVLAHSMGADLTAHTFAFLRPSRSSNTTASFPRLVLAAADVGTKYFGSKLRTKLLDSTDQVTSYCSDDAILSLASRINASDERLGYCVKPKETMRGIELVTVRGPSMDYGNHSYFLTSREVLMDIKQLLEDRKRRLDGRQVTTKVSQPN